MCPLRFLENKYDGKPPTLSSAAQGRCAISRVLLPTGRKRPRLSATVVRNRDLQGIYTGVAECSRRVGKPTVLLSQCRDAFADAIRFPRRSSEHRLGEHPRGTNTAVVSGSTNNSSTPVSRKRDRLALVCV